MTTDLGDREDSAATYRGLLEAAPDAMVVVNRGGEIVLVNLQAEKQFQYRRGELVGQTVNTIIPEGFADRLIADAIRAAGEAPAQQIGTGIELAGRRKDGKWFPIEILLSSLQIGVEILVTAVIRDISVRKDEEQHLARMEGRYRGLLEAAPDVMVLVNQRGEIVLMNLQAKKRFGYQRHELTGKHVKNILLPENLVERLLADALQSAECPPAERIPTAIELEGRQKDGSEFPIEIMLSPLETVEGLLVTVAIRDISVRKDAEKQLAQVEAGRRLVEEALRQSEERYRMVLEGIQNYSIFMMDPRGQIVSWNAGAERIKGYAADQIIGRNFSCFFPPEAIERGRPEEVLRMTAANGRHEEQGMRVRRDGSRFLASLTFTALRDPSGNLLGFSELSHDLSESKESGAKYRGLLEAAPDAMVVVNQGGEIVLLNLQAEKRFGYYRDELVGQKVTNIIPEGFAERLLADGLRSAEDALAQQIGTGIELTGRRKDGSEFPIEIMLSPLESAEGVLVTAAIRNISVRKEAEKHLSQMEGRYRGLLEAAPDPMVLVTLTGEIVLVNLQAEKQFGYRRDELVGRAGRGLLSEESVEIMVAYNARVAATGYPPRSEGGIEVHGRRQDGSTFPMEVMLGRLETPEGSLLTVALRDITTRKEAEAQLLAKVKELNRSNEELAQFAYMASHDLQEPLRMVASYTQLLSRRYKGQLDADADEFIAFAVDGATRMQRLIEDLLAYSRVGTKGAELVDTSSQQALDQAIVNLRGAIEDSGALVTHDPLPTVTADLSQLIQLFQNLIGNAIKYQNPGIPRVHVSSAKEGTTRWLFSVRDNGLGIESKYFERIFGMFQRLHKREEFTGTGIGLSICKKIVERHGGNISVESRLGHGSTFRFALAGSENRS